MFNFSQVVLTENRKRVKNNHYVSSCPLFLRKKVVGELYTETRVRTFMIDGVKKFQAKTEFTFDLCKAAEPAVLTGRFTHTADALDLRLPLSSTAIESTRPMFNPRLKITAKGAKRTAAISADLPTPTNLAATLTQNSLTAFYEGDFSFNYNYSSVNPPTAFLVMVYQGTYQNRTGEYILHVYVPNILESGETYTIPSNDRNLMAAATPYVLTVRALNSAWNLSPIAYLEFVSPFPAPTNLHKVSQSLNSTNQVNMTFEFDTEQVPDYYLIAFQEGTFDSPTGVSESFKFYSPDKTVEFSNQTPMN